MPWLTAVALAASFMVLAHADTPVCDLSDEAVITAFTSGDSEISVADGPEPGGKALGLLFRPVNDWPSARYELPDVQDWSRADLLVVTLRNDGPQTATIEVGVEDSHGNAHKPARRIRPGVWTEIRIPIANMIHGRDEGAWCGTAIDVTRVDRFWFLAYSPNEPLPVRFASIRLVTLPRLAAPELSARGASDGVALTWTELPGARCYDVFRRARGEAERRIARFPVSRFVDISAQPGTQYIYRVAAVDELLRAGRRSRAVRAQTDSGAPAALPSLDRYGGRTDIQLPATGFFRLGKVGERHVLVTPNGHPMLSVGICVISLGDSYTRVSKREHLFADVLAEKDDPRFKDAWNPPYGYEAYGLEAGTGLVFSPYVRGLILKYGADWRKQWEAETRRRLADWRINTAAAWSGSMGIPYVNFAAGWGDTPRIPTRDGYLNVPDVFDPAFERAVEANSGGAAKARDDPYLIGWFTANEMGWYGDWQNGMNLVRCIHAAPEELAAKAAWVDFLAATYESIEALNAAWGTDWEGVDAIRENREKLPNKPGARKDASAFLDVFADRYFRLTSEAIRRNDPNHLLLGARHSQGAPAEVIRAESRYNDVVSATIYGLRPRRPVSNGSTDTDRPWIAGEFHFQAEDAGLPFREVEGIFPTQAERGDAYQDYIADGFALPNFIGAHWFEYIDEPATGRFDGGKDGGECHNIGWVDVRDEVWTDFADRAKLVNANLPLVLR